MEAIIINPTEKTPYIRFDSNSNKLEIKGKSIPENPTEFYKPLIDNIGLYVATFNSTMQVDIQLDYFNTYSSKCILDLFKSLETICCKGCQVIINWYYEEEDLDLFEAGKDYEAMVNLTFNINQVKAA